MTVGGKYNITDTYRSNGKLYIRSDGMVYSMEYPAPVSAPIGSRYKFFGCDVGFQPYIPYWNIEDKRGEWKMEFDMSINYAKNNFKYVVPYRLIWDLEIKMGEYLHKYSKLWR